MSLPQSFDIQVKGGRMSIPSVGYGTWASDGTNPTTPASPQWIKDPIKTAFDVGYRHLDMAWFYGVDREVGQAIRESGLPRSELFICSKVWPNFYHPQAVELCCDKILTGLRTDYIDCLLLHWPCAFLPESLAALQTASADDQADMKKKGMKDGKVLIDWEHSSEPIAQADGHQGSIVPTWNAMKDLVKKGKARSIGVSNFGIADLNALLPHAQDIPISLNQVEAHPWFPNNELVEFHKQHGILTTCFSPFAGQKSDGATLLQNPTVQELARKNGMDVGQLLQSWAVQRGAIPLGKSANAQRISSNFNVRALSPEDTEVLNGMEIPDGRGRTIDWTEGWGVKLWQ